MTFTTILLKNKDILNYLKTIENLQIFIKYIYIYHIYTILFMNKSIQI